MKVSAKYLYKYGFNGRKSPQISQNQLYLHLTLFAQSQSLILLLLLHFSIFLFGILKSASQLNLAAITFSLTRFLDFKFGAILGSNYAKIVPNWRQIRNSKIRVIK